MEEPATVWEHLDELRTLLIRVVAIITVGFIACLIGFQTLFTTLLTPFEKPQVQISSLKEIHNSGSSPATYYVNGQNIHLEPGQRTTVTIPDKESLVILSPLEGITTMFKLCLWAALILTSPIWLYSLFLFISPALEQSARMIIPFIVLLLSFGAGGLTFAYTFTIPLANVYLAAFNSEIGQNFWGLSQYVDYTILLLLSHAFMFELAAILLLLVHYGTISYETIAGKRRHAYLTSFIAAALVTPPDVFTQIALGIPMVMMYELIIIYGWLRSKRKLLNPITP
jgi:sec-independent protein translocase protein TatC